MKEKLYDDLARLSLKRELSVEDRLRIEAALAAHPEVRERWEADAALGRTLGTLRDAPLSSNFTARVLEGIDMDERAAERAGTSPRPAWLRWLQPRLTSAIALALLAVLGAYEYHSYQRTASAQKRLALDVGSQLASIPSSLPAPEIFSDFDAINSMRQVSAGSDDELLTVLQQ